MKALVLDQIDNRTVADVKAIDLPALTEGDVRRLPGELCATLLSSGVTLPDIESQLLEFAVQQSRGNLAAAARQLGLTRPQLAYRLQRSAQKPSS